MNFFMFIINVINIFTDSDVKILMRGFGEVAVIKFIHGIEREELD